MWLESQGSWVKPTQKSNYQASCNCLPNETDMDDNQAQDYAMAFVFIKTITGLILGLCPANGRRRYKVTPSLIGWAQT